jgi:hypothetical protein
MIGVLEEIPCSHMIDEHHRELKKQDVEIVAVAVYPQKPTC